MEGRRLLLGIALMIGVMVLSNLLFPPLRPPPGQVADSVAVSGDTAGAVSAVEPPRADSPVAAGQAGQEAAEAAAEAAARIVGPEVAAEPAAEPSDTVVVRSPLYEFRFDTRGAALISARLFDYPSYAPGVEEGSDVELIRPGDRVLGYRVALGRDTIDMRGLGFEPTATSLDVGPDGAQLTFHRQIEDTPLALRVTYRFRADRYLFGVEGAVEGLGGRGHVLLVGLGRGLGSNEANPREDFGQMALVVADKGERVASERLGGIDPGESRPADGGPFSWAASKSKYFLAAVVSEPEGPGFGGVMLTGVSEPDAAQMEVGLPVPAGSAGFQFDAYLGPQDFERLRQVGQGLQNVNPFGWRWLQWFIRPFGAIVVSVLVWMQGTFSLAYGWVLILFGIVSRIVLFPVYQVSMRQQMKQMAVQPLLKEIQEKHKDDPQKLQQEMMGLYREHGVNPLGGCLPMLAPFPILITLFFVFQNTIEFRGVPFLWIPDLSLKDPLYLVPVFMGASMLLLNWIGQRGMETNTQMKMFTYVIPVVFTFLFANFAAGLNLYYAASNVASLPQQVYLAKERRQRRAAGPPPKKPKPARGPGAATKKARAPGAAGRKGAGRKGAGRKGRPAPGERT